MTRQELLRMPPGDRAPALRQAALHLLAKLDAAEAAAVSGGAKQTRSAAIMRTRLNSFAAFARFHGVSLPTTVAVRVAHPSKGKTMTSTTFPSLFEDLSESPIHDEIRKLLRAQIERGDAPVEVIEAALAIATALCVDSEGMAKTAVRLLHVGDVLGNASPEMRAKVATEQHKAGATAH